MIRLAHPLALLLLLLPLLLLVVWRWRRRRPALLFSSERIARAAPRTLRTRLLGVPPFLRIACLALLVVAIARPQAGFGRVRTTADAVAIELVVDRSSSMTEAMSFAGERLTRFEVVQRVVRDFVLGDDAALEGRPADPIGMVAFAGYAETVCPLTRAHDALVGLMETTETARFRQEDGTAIGDAVALAAARLRKAEEDLARQTDEGAAPNDLTIKSRVIILLTDGRNNAGAIDPVQAAQVAADWGITIYAIGIGDGGGRVIRTPFGDRRLPGLSGVDEQTLRRMAELTGGQYWTAGDAETLREVYARIDELEKTEITSIEYTNYQERYPPLALAALVALTLEALLASTWLRRSP